MKSHQSPLPFQIVDAMRAWGMRMSIARRSRRWTIRDLASKAQVSPGTVIAAERGEASIRLESWLRLVWTLELARALEDAARAGTDAMEFELMAAELPKRVRR